jgi:extracellular matrix regulatory protein B
MYLDLSPDTVILNKNIIGIFDTDTSTVVKNTRDYLAKAEKNGLVMTVTTDIPRSFTVLADRNDKTNQTVIISKYSTLTLLSRVNGRK